MPTKFDSRTFVRIDQGYDEHPKVFPLSDAGFRAHVEAICWSGRNPRQNGVIPRAVARKKWRPKIITELVESGLFDEHSDGYEVIRCAAGIADRLFRFPPASRSPIPPRLRAEVIARDGYLCGICGADVPLEDVHLDHIKPLSRGGPTNLTNLRVTH